MEKVDLKKRFAEYKGDFFPIGEDFTIGGWSLIETKKGAMEALTLVRIKDGLVVAVFADQLRQDGDKLLVSKAHLLKQIARQEEWARGVSPKKLG